MAQYVDFMINGRPTRAMVDTGAQVNIMNNTASKKFGLRCTPSNAQHRIVNAPPTPVSGDAHGVSITLGECQGKTNLIVAPFDIFDIIIRQEFL